MKRPSFDIYFITLLPVLLIMSVSGCAYFNTYYNAQKLYKSASKKHDQFPDTIAVTSSEKIDLKKAIDKYSEVVLKYPNSRWVPPSLFYMGNSYYFSGQYDKASRKYQELWQYYPNSKYSAPAQLNNAQISYRLKQWDRSLWDLSQIKSNDNTIVAKAAYLEALVWQTIPDFPRAAIFWERFLFKHYKSNLAGTARYNYAVCLMGLGEYTNSIRELEMLLDGRIKKGIRYQASMLLGQCYQKTNRHSAALKIYYKLNKRETDKEKNSNIELEIANCRARQMTDSAAVEQYQSLARRYPKTPVASVAFYQIAEIFEKEQNLDSALGYYNAARNENPTSIIREPALKKSADIALLLAYRQQSDQQALAQSAKLQFLMAEHYLFELNQADSAVSAYKRVASDINDRTLSAKAWYAAAWTIRNYLSDTVESNRMFDTIITQYPKTRYANGARTILNLPIDTTIIDQEPQIEMNIKPIKPKNDNAPTIPNTPGDSLKIEEPSENKPGMPPASKPQKEDPDIDGTKIIK